MHLEQFDTSLLLLSRCVLAVLVHLPLLLLLLPAAKSRHLIHGVFSVH
jgi:hypothetical protein